MVWTYELSCPALKQHAETSDSPLMAVGTLHDGTYSPPAGHHHNSFHLLHQTVLHHLPCHIHNFVHVHQHNRVHRHNLAHPRHRRFLHLSHARPALQILVKHPRRTTTKLPESTALISTLIGRKTLITTTIRRSTGSLFQGPFVRRLSHRSWTLKDVILCRYQWRLSCSNHWLRKLAHGRELYLIPTGTLLQWCSPRNFPRS